MKPLALIRRALIGLLGTALGMGTLVMVAHADELNGLTADQAADGSIEILSAADVELRYCSKDADGRMWLELPTGHRFELITDLSDPSIVNKGDGAFHAFDPAEVRAAIDQVRFSLSELEVDVFILPYPRRGGLESAAAPGMILLSPGVRPLSLEHQHAEVVHELGHVVQYALMPDLDREAWSRYRSLRGIGDEKTYWSGADHANRPHEIFAEDFRALFGSALANYSGTIENAALAHPANVQGLHGFMAALAGDLPRTIAFSAYPNPSRGALTFTRSGAAGSPLDLFDPQGRRVATLDPEASPLGVQWTWDGRDAAGRRVEPGILFARARDGSASTVRVTILP
jgi:hypothetical protein